jgi:hypothetical protein
VAIVAIISTLASLVVGHVSIAGCVYLKGRGSLLGHRNKKPAAPPVKEPFDMNELVPLSILALDLEPPAGGWHAYLAGRGVAVVRDSTGREAIHAEHARELFTEKREAAERARVMAEANDRAVIEADRRWRASLPHGQRWWELPDGVLPATAMLQHAKDEQPKRRTLLEDAFAGTPTVMYVDEPRPAFEDES